MGLLRKFLAWLSVLVLCLFGLFFYMARPFNPDNNRYLAWVISRVGHALLGMKCTVIGRENMPQDRPTVVIANHQHNDDLFMLGGLLPPRTVTVGKKALIWVPFFGQVFWLGGNVIIDRSRSNKAVAVMRATADAISRERKSLWIFPEGTRSRGRRRAHHHGVRQPVPG
jgi:1-acyl-sn-glycerol-3-phosphate acyltransferase